MERVRTKIMKCLCIREVPAKLEELPFGPVFSVKVIPGADRLGTSKGPKLVQEFI